MKVNISMPFIGLYFIGIIVLAGFFILLEQRYGALAQTQRAARVAEYVQPIPPPPQQTTQAQTLTHQSVQPQPMTQAPSQRTQATIPPPVQTTNVWSDVWKFLMPVTPTPTVALPPRRVTDDVMIDIISHVPDKRTPISFFLYDTADTESVSFTNQVVAQLRRLGYQRVAVDGSMVGGAPKERYFSYNVLPGNVIGILVYKNEQPTY